MEKVIQVKDLSFSYNHEKILSDISFDIPKGSISFVVGPNGSGKTTLMKLLLGFLKPEKGEISVFGKNPADIRKDVGYVPQGFVFDKSFPITVREFLKASYSDADSLSVHKHTHHLDIDSLLEKRVGELSGGQLQRVLIARSMQHDPKILYFDEPVSGIDISGEETIYDTVRYLQETHDVTIVMISHELDVIHDVADQVICVNKELICEGVPLQALTPEVMAKLYGQGTALHDHSAHH